MAGICYKQKCKRCNKNYVLSSPRARYIVCEECQTKEMNGVITDPEMKKMFDIPQEFYKNYFLRDIKVKYLKYGSLSENQISAFKKAVHDLTQKAKLEKKKSSKKE